MKQIILMVSALVIALSLCACGSTENENVSIPTDAAPEQTAQTPSSSPLPDAAGQEEEPGWMGEYKNEEAFCSVAVSDFNGTSFHFEIFFLRDGHLLCDGDAAVSSDNRFTAQYGDFSFVLSNDYGTIDISVLESSEWAHLSGSYERLIINSSPRLDTKLEGFVWKTGNEYILDGEVTAYIATLPDGDDIKKQIEGYLGFQDSEVSEWLSFEADEALSKQTTYPAWIAEYYIGSEEDTNLCVDAVVQMEWDGTDYTLILHTVRDADLDMNSDVDYGARIKELFETITVTADAEE